MFAKHLFRSPQTRSSSAAILLALAASAVPAAALALTQAELDASRNLWNSHNLLNYDYRMQRDCLCFGDAARPGIVAVRGDAIVSVTDADTLLPLDSQFFLTINQSFGRLQHGLDVNAFNIMADFDAVLGYPTFVRIDYDQFLIDEEEIYRAQDLTAVPEPTTAVLGLCPLAAACVVTRWRRRATQS